jgi:quercetin dioxygenase-like cupin family protein
MACAICSAAGLVATAVDAPAQTPAQTGGLTRTMISTIDYPGDGKVSILMSIEVGPDFVIAPHTHPGVESAMVTEGEITLDIAGRPTRTYKAGEGYQVPPGAIHGGKNGGKPAKLTATFIVEKDKPLASPA